MNIKYPTGIKPKSGQSNNSYLKQRPKSDTANRGMDFEAAINQTNEYYKQKGLCLITKRPTPIKVLKVDYSSGAKITSAVYEKQSTTDYNGIYQGRYIDFEAKSTKENKSFPLNNIQPQQIDHLQKVIEQKGIAFFLIRLERLQKIYLIDAQIVIDFYQTRERASIPFTYIEENGIEVQEGFNPRIDYLKAMKKLYSID